MSVFIDSDGGVSDCSFSSEDACVGHVARFVSIESTGWLDDSIGQSAQPLPDWHDVDPHCDERRLRIVIDRDQSSVVFCRAHDAEKWECHGPDVMAGLVLSRVVNHCWP